MSHKTLVIGWDGATFDLIKPWAQAGYLPTLARLLKEGAHGELHAYPNMNSASAWSSIVTGCNPGKHGIYDFGDSFDTQAKTWHPITALDRKRDPFWRILSTAGQAVHIINVPISYPADPINGFMISGMDAPDSAAPNATHPSGLIQKLRAAGIEYVLDVPNLKEFRRRDPYRLAPLVREMVEARTRTLLYFMEQQTWDTLMAVYIATDRMQHFYWGTRDDLADPTWTPLRELYVLLDAHLGQLLKRAGDDTTVLLISDHGFGRGSQNRHDLNPLFARLGWLQYRQRQASLQARLLKNFLVYGRRYLPPRLQYYLATHFPRWRQRALGERHFGNLDWTRTQVFGHPYNGSVSVNLQGRDPHGIVRPEQYDAVCEKARELIAQLTDPVTGKPLAKTVRRRHEIYHGDFVTRAPDLMIEWARQSEPHGMRWDGGGEPLIIQPRQTNQNSWTGTHRSEGIFIAHGPHIRRNAQIHRVLQYDVAPTILYLQGLPLPSDLDGRVLTELFEPDYLHSHPIANAAPSATPTPTNTSELSEQDAALVEKRLRDLGYIE